MVGWVARACCIVALFQGVATGLAGCKTTIGDGPTPSGAGPSGDDGPTGPGLGDDSGDDGDGVCAGDPCDVYEQCGCQGGEACDLDGSALAEGATKCRGVASPGQTQSNC